MADSIVSVPASRNIKVISKKYRLDEKARKEILSMSDSVRLQKFGNTSITKSKIERQRQAFIKHNGNEF